MGPPDGWWKPARAAAGGRILNCAVPMPERLRTSRAAPAQPPLGAERGSDVLSPLPSGDARLSTRFGPVQWFARDRFDESRAARSGRAWCGRGAGRSRRRADGGPGPARTLVGRTARRVAAGLGAAPSAGRRPNASRSSPSPPVSPRSRRCANWPASSAGIKWPNDVVVADRKLAGILAEKVGDVVVVGMGLNVHWESFPADLAEIATACNLCAAAPVTREELLVRWLTRSTSGSTRSPERDRRRAGRGRPRSAGASGSSCRARRSRRMRSRSRTTVSSSCDATTAREQRVSAADVIHLRARALESREPDLEVGPI